MLTQEDFVNRHFKMREVYRKEKVNEDDTTTEADDDDDDDDEDDDEGTPPTKADDPFYHAPGFVIMGISELSLDSLAYELSFKDDIFIQDSTGQNVGTILITLHPCEADGTIKENTLREDPDEAIGNDISFNLSIESATFKSPQWSRQKVSYEHE